MRKAVVILVVALLLGSGAWYYAYDMASTRVASEQTAFWAELTRDCGEDLTYFTKYDALVGYTGDRVALLISGFESPNPVVRWFAAYKSIEYVGTSSASNFDRGLRKINDDPVEEVKQAARFAISFYDGNYKFHSWVVSSPNNEIQVYHRYHDAQYNDGQVWVIKNGQVSQLQTVAGSIGNMHFAPDSNLIAINYGGRTWGAVSTVNVGTGEATEVLPWAFLESQGVEFFSKTPRPDPYVVFREWNEQGDQMLLYYAYHTPEYERMYGHAVYDVTANKVLRATMPAPQSDVIFLDKAALGWE